ncbi:MAG: transcription termination/antitermination NusG family protein [Wenzhouxiangella sp.]
MIDPRHSGSGKRWHAVFCKPKQDAIAEEHLLHQGFEIFRPKTQTRIRRNGRRVLLTESMFPRYLFIHLDSQGEDWTPIRSTRGAVGLVRMGLHTPVIPDPVIQMLRERCDEQGVVNLAGQIDFQPNDLVEIIDGPCAGYRALFQSRSSEERVIVLLTLLQHERSVELEERCIRRA